MNNVQENPVVYLKDKLQPTHFSDCYSVLVSNGSFKSARDLALAVGRLTPGWLKMLMNIRDAVVKPLGLKTVDKESQKEKDILAIAPVIEETPEVIVFGLNDSHLNFLASLRLENSNNSEQKLSIETVVKFNNYVGRSYFFFIKPFHKLIIKTLLKNLSKSVKTDRK